MLYIIGTIIGGLIVLLKFIFSTENGTFKDGMEASKNFLDELQEPIKKDK